MNQPKNTIDTTTLRPLLAEALTVATRLISHLDDTHQATLDSAIAGGARLVMELGPLPDLARLQIVLVEREGARQNVVGVAL